MYWKEENIGKWETKEVDNETAKALYYRIALAKVLKYVLNADDDIPEDYFFDIVRNFLKDKECPTSRESDAIKHSLFDDLLDFEIDPTDEKGKPIYFNDDEKDILFKGSKTLEQKLRDGE
tara:strand:- start:9184 stop:9543 length:360 start_codon:yes stop_codon:yes gene_type:complete